MLPTPTLLSVSLQHKKSRLPSTEFHSLSNLIKPIIDSAPLLSSFYSPSSTVQVVLSTAHPAKFSEAVTRALNGESQFDFERDVLPEEFKGLLERKRNVIDVEAAEVDLVKNVIERFAGTDEGEGSARQSV